MIYQVQFKNGGGIWWGSGNCPKDYVTEELAQAAINKYGGKSLTYRIVMISPKSTTEIKPVPSIIRPVTLKEYTGRKFR